MTDDKATQNTEAQKPPAEKSPPELWGLFFIGMGLLSVVAVVQSLIKGDWGGAVLMVLAGAAFVAVGYFAYLWPGRGAFAKRHLEPFFERHGGVILLVVVLALAVLLAPRVLKAGEKAYDEHERETAQVAAQALTDKCDRFKSCLTTAHCALTADELASFKAECH